MAGNLTAMIAAIFSGSAVSTDPYFNLTTLLLSTTATNGQQNNTFQDSSTNNFTITRNPATGPNAPTQGTFSPFSQTGWGNYFSGSYLTVPASADFNLGTNDFCIEFWLNAISPATYGGILSFDSGGDYPVNFSYASANSSNLQANFGSASAWYFTAFFDTSTATNQWDHYVATRSGSTFRIFKNGVLKATGTNSGSIGASSGTVNINANGTAAGTTYLSNLRIINGSIPTSYQTSSTTVGTTIFTVPTSPLTTTSQGATAADVKLLTCQSNRFVDSSTSSPKTITLSGSPQVVAFSPFNPTSSWSAATNGGSGYFDGTGDYLDELTATTAFNLSSGDWTLEAWIYRNAASANHAIVNLYNSAGSNTGLTFYVNSSNQLVTDNGATAALSAGTVPSSSWVHLAISRNSGTTTGYINGVSVGTTTQVPSAAQYARIGNLAAGPYNFNGYIANVRIVKGTAVYTGNFTPPTAPLSTSGSASASAYPSTTNVNTSFASSACSLLLNFTNSGIYDATAKNVLETVGDAQASTAITPKWGTTSMKFDGTGDYAVSPASPLNAFLTGDFTCEFWIYFNALATNQTVMGTASGFQAGGYQWIQLASNTLTFRMELTTGAINVATGTLSTGQWYHMAATRSGTTVRVFVNGVLANSTTTGGSISDSTGNKVVIGNTVELQATRFFNGYLQDVRVTRGYARYTANFTPPTAAFPVQ
jgi:hypothetical protein